MLQWSLLNFYMFLFSSSDLGGNETLLLDMVRAKSRELEEAQDKTLKLPRDDVSDELVNWTNNLNSYIIIFLRYNPFAIITSSSF